MSTDKQVRILMKPINQEKNTFKGRRLFVLLTTY